MCSNEVLPLRPQSMLTQDSGSEKIIRAPLVQSHCRKSSLFSGSSVSLSSNRKNLAPCSGTANSYSAERVISVWELTSTSKICALKARCSLSLLKVLTKSVARSSHQPLMGEDEVLTQVHAWRIYDEWLSDERVVFLPEPTQLDKRFRELTQVRRAAPKDWADSYLIAFAQAAGLQLVTFDKAMSHRVLDVVRLATE